MLRRRLLYGGVFIAALLFQIFYWGYLAHFLLALTVTLPFLSLLLSLPAMLACRVELEPALPAAAPGSQIGWRLTLEGRRPLPLSRVTLRLSVRHTLTGRVQSTPLRLTGAAPGQTIFLPADSAHCGKLEARVQRVRVCDYLGLFTLRRPSASAQLLVLPRSVPVQLPPGLSSALHNSAAGGRPRPGGGPGEDYALRPYRPGDSLRMVHWKCSSKGDELMVRETLEGGQDPVLFTFDHLGSLAGQESVLEQLYALGRTILDRKLTCLVRWAHPLDGQIRSFRVSDSEELRVMLDAALSDPLPAQGRSVLEFPIQISGPDCPALHLHLEPGEEASHAP